MKLLKNYLTIKTYFDPDDSEDVEDEDEVEAETADALVAEDEEELGSTFGTNADSFTESPASAQHYA